MRMKMMMITPLTIVPFGYRAGYDFLENTPTIVTNSTSDSYQIVPCSNFIKYRRENRNRTSYQTLFLSYLKYY